MPQLTVTHPDNSTETIAETVGYTRTLEIGSMRRARIQVERALADSVSLTEKEDDIQIGSGDELRLVNIETGGSYWTLECYSYEWLANNVEPFAGGTEKTGTDDALVTDLVGDVSEWSEGTINQVSSKTLAPVYSHAARHEALRELERKVAGELKFRDTGTVDYTDRLGSDKSGSITLSAANQNIEEEITITKRGRDLDGTHFRVIGAHEGESQFFVNLVPSVDSDSYDNRVNYSTSRWSDGDTKNWDVWPNKDTPDQDTLEAEAAALGGELSDPLVEAQTTIPDSVNVSLGDTVQVVKPDADLDRSMRIHRIKEMVSGATKRLKVLLSTRTNARRDGNEDLRSKRQFDTNFEGSSITIQGGGSRQPVDASNNAEIPFFYPDVVEENNAEIQVRGLAYRAYSSGAADNADFKNVVTDSVGLGTVSVDSTSWTTITSFTPSKDLSVLYGWLGHNPRSSDDVKVRYRNTTTGENYRDTGIFWTNTREPHYLTAWAPENVNGDTIAWQGQSRSTNVDVDFQSFFQGIGQHTHDPNPGITEFASDTPTGVDVQVTDGNNNTSTVATDIGTGTFETTVDLSGELTPNAWNLVELTSDDLGHIQGTISVEAYDQIGTN